jgi:hypothetical protein
MRLNGTRVGLLAVAAVVAGSSPAAAGTITAWSFTAAAAAPDNSPAPSTGAGAAITLGMTNNYNGGNVASDDVLATPGTADPTFTENAWRIRGTANNGWAIAAPQYSQGVEFDVSTVGYSGISLSFDWYATTQGIRDLQVQYNLNTSNSTGWTNLGGTSPTGTFIAVPNDWYGGATPSTPMITVSFASITGANNNPNFGVRLVSAYDSTGNLGPEYASATLGANGQTVEYNNSSGNWRFDNISISGTANTATPAFFTGEVSVGSNFFYLQFPDNNLFGYYEFLSSSILYHADMGYEAFIPSTGTSIYFYDFESGHWFYSSASQFPSLYDFTLNTWLYYFPNTNNPGHYTTNPRSFYDFTTQKIINM